MMTGRELITLFFLLFLSAAVCIESWRLGLGNFNAPGPGFLPFGASLVMGLLVVVLFLKEKGRGLRKDVAPLFRGRRMRNVIFVLGVLFAYPLLLYRLGFFLCTLLFVGFCTRMVGQTKWKSAAVISLSTAIISYLLFDIWLDIRIPKGTWVRQVFP